jgi:hypothetical protein
MKPVHTIRLHGPWQAKLIRKDYQSPETTSAGIKPGAQTKLKIPDDWGNWLGIEFRGLVEFDRAFGMPTGLEANQEIWLVIEQVDYRAKIWLNQNADAEANGEAPLGELQLGQSPFRRSIRQLMQARNRLHLEIELPVDVERAERRKCAGGLIGEVRLEIA